MNKIRSIKTQCAEVDSKAPLHESEKPVEVDCEICNGEGTIKINLGAGVGVGDESEIDCIECNEGKVMEN